jgi:hypothetical protein
MILVERTADVVGAAAGGGKSGEKPFSGSRGF